MCRGWRGVGRVRSLVSRGRVGIVVVIVLYSNVAVVAVV